MYITRRRMLATVGSLAFSAAGGPAFPNMGPDDKFDLVIKGGEVLDPSQSLRGRRDIGIRFGVIESVEHELHKHWVIGVQWHPERMIGHALSESLFRALVQATRAAAHKT